MGSIKWFALLADVVLVSHFLFVLFVLLGFLSALIGTVAGWQWVRRPWFRRLHLAAVAVVVFQAWLGLVCPLTTLESWLRARAGEAAYQDTFIRHWISRLLFYDAEAWVFTLVYTIFGAAVVLVWFLTRSKP